MSDEELTVVELEESCILFISHDRGECMDELLIHDASLVLTGRCLPENPEQAIRKAINDPEIQVVER